MRPGVLMVAEYSKPGYWLIDVTEQSNTPIKINDHRAEHNSGCTDLQFVPGMYQEKKFPYVVARCKFGIDLVDIDEKLVYSLCKESSTSSLGPKMAILTSKQANGHSIKLYFNA